MNTNGTKLGLDRALEAEANKLLGESTADLQEAGIISKKRLRTIREHEVPASMVPGAWKQMYGEDADPYADD